MNSSKHRGVQACSVLVATWGTLSMGACGCDNIDCSSTLTIELDRDASLPEGLYTISVTTPNAVSVAECDLSKEYADTDCRFYTDGKLSSKASFEGRWTVTEFTAPESLTLEIVFDDIKIFEENLTPMYQKVHVSENACDQSPCLRASEIIEVRV